MKIITVESRDWEDFTKTFQEKFNEMAEEFVIVNTSVFFDRISESHKGVICYYV